jgi:hypothetical protein
MDKVIEIDIEIDIVITDHLENYRENYSNLRDRDRQPKNA